MRVVVACGSMALLIAASALAEDAVVGKYSGSYSAQSAVPVALSLDIKSADNGVIQGVGIRSVPRAGSSCNGEFAFKGTLKGDRINVVAEKFGSSGDCTFRFNGTVSGNKLVGKVGQIDVELSK